MTNYIYNYFKINHDSNNKEKGQYTWQNVQKDTDILLGVLLTNRLPIIMFLLFLLKIKE